MDDLRYRLALGGLLHDIGKFAYRAGETFDGADRWWKQASKEEREPYGYYHAYLGAWFAERYLPRKWSVEDLVARHHRPTTPEERIVALADTLSAGEREKEDEPQPGEDPIRQLRPIFGSVSLHGKKLEENRIGYLPLRPLALKRSVIFPYQAHPGEDVEPRYRAMWEDFCQEVAFLKQQAEANTLALPAYLEALQALMMRYTWAVPSAYWKSVPDVSLYDHSRMTAALAVALADFDDATVQDLLARWRAFSRRQEFPEDPGPAVAQLVGGDISGVQKFIYTIAAKGAAKMLRGRSFYLQLLTEAVLRYVLRRLNLPYTSVIYAGGGNFYLLTPVGARARLEDLQADIARILLRYHGTDLYLVLGWAEVPLAGFLRKAFPDYWSAMHRHLQERKQRRYAELGPDDLYAHIFQVPDYGGNPDAVCSVCGSEMRRVGPWDEWEAQERICTLCRSFADDLGRALPHSTQVRWRWSEPEEGDPRAATWRTALQAFGAQVALEGRKEDRDTPAWQQPDAIWLLDDPATWPRGRVAWLRYTVHRIPMVESREEAEAINARLPEAERQDKHQRAEARRPKTFSHLQVQTRSGFHRLGVLRMDVDDLGLIFSRGLGEKATLSRLAALSFQMSLFFEGWVKRVLEDPDAAWHNLIYPVYAGGDDLFLVGPWDVMPDLALRIVEDFAAYTGGHPALHLSGGMAFVHGKYPIYQAAEDAGEAEEQAKALEGKNAFAFLGRAWKWKPEEGYFSFRELKDAMEELVKAVEQGENRALLRVLQELAALQMEPDERPVLGPRPWIALYRLHRARRNYPETVHPVFDRLQVELQQDLGRLVLWSYAARWAEILTRKAPVATPVGGFPNPPTW